MPVYRNYLMRDGSRMLYADPDYERRFREHLIETQGQLPSWRYDPTYNLRRRR